MTTIVEHEVDAGAFADRVFESAMATVDVFSMYVGEKLGLYEALAHLGPLTRDQLTRHAEIHWRYAQEWLEQQTVSGILEVDDPSVGAAERRYSLPAEAAEVLLDRDSVAYLAPFVRIVMAGGLAIPSLLEAYRTGGGISWAELGPDARTGQSDMNRPWYLGSIGSEWFPQVPDLHAVVSEGGRVADIACGEGWSSIAIALAYPNAIVDGFDVDGPSIEAARRHAEAAGVSDRVQFHQADVADLDQEGTHDAVVGFEFVHDLPHPSRVLAAMRRMARAGAPIVVMDENVPDRFTGAGNDVERAMYGFSLFICLPDGMSHQPSAATGTVMRSHTIGSYAVEAGFSGVTTLPIENDLWRFYRMEW
jgi:2-polyprenyl-3-methyl-5-hydroxy-6-metoxy-1,4-benzoquinol methylase